MSKARPHASFRDAAALLERGRFHDAAKMARECVTRDPRDANSWQIIGMAAKSRGRFDEAIAAFESLVNIMKRDARAWCQLGSAQTYAGLFDEADATFATALSLSPNFGRALAGRAEMLQRKGDSAAALVAIEPVIASGDALPEDQWMLASIQLGNGDAAACVATCERILAAGELRPPTERKTHFLLGKAHDKLGDEDAAFSAWTAGNEHGLPPGSPATRPAKVADDFDHEVRRLIEVFPEVPPPGIQYGRNNDDRPVMVVGAPRSGSTLIEQIIDAHPLGCGIGEVPTFPEAMSKLSATFAKGRVFPDWVPNVNRRGLDRASASYTDGIARARRTEKRDATRIVDKNLLNLSLVGLAATMMPNARFILCHRDAIENGLSVWMNDLSPVGFPWSGDLVAIGRRMAATEKLIAHWERVLGDRVIRVEYKAMVDDVETETRRILEYLDLPWDDACLRFHESGRNVTTLSFEQVRQPIYRTALSRSERYAAHLTPMRDAYDTAS